MRTAILCRPQEAMQRYSRGGAACALIVVAVHTASQKPARRRLFCQLITNDRCDGDIRSVFGVACYVCSGAFPKRETRNPKRNGGHECHGRLARPECIVYPNVSEVNTRFLACQSGNSR